ncbi:MAG: adenine phosphoribosyltransferase [Thiovulaceae bacterium]|nr:adenine phosphoribosyltransferase [Sulfurimonadaceae bacterium]
MQLSQEERAIIEGAVRDIPDFPKPGIIFKDITTILNNAKAFNTLQNHLYDRYKSYDLDYVAGIDARGFIFGSVLARDLGIGFVPIRKKGKLPYTTVSEKYVLEYGIDEVEIHIDAFKAKPNARVLLIDDLIATGGTANASASLITKVGAECVEACFIMGLTLLEGIKKLEKNTAVYSVIEVD